MAPQESLSFDTAPQTLASKKQEGGASAPKTLETTDPRRDAFTRCSRVFLNDIGNPVWDREDFFDFLKKQPNSKECYKILTTCSEDSLKKLFDADEGLGFKGMKSLTGIEIMLKQEWQTIKQEWQTIKQEWQIEKDNKALELKEKLKKVRVNLKEKHPDLYQKYGEIIEKNNPSSEVFKDAVKNILSELKAHAEKTGDIREYASFVEQFHAIGAVSHAEFAVFKRELSEMTKKLPDDKNGAEQRSEFKLPEGFHANKDIDGVYTRYASNMLGDAFDEVVTIDKEGKGSKDVISAKSGYKIHLEDVVDLKEQGLVKKESDLHSVVENRMNMIGKTDEFMHAETESMKRNPEGSGESKWKIEETERYKKELLSEIEKMQTELKVVQEQIRHDQEAKKWTEWSIRTREEQAHDTIDFVDSMGLHVLGVENVDMFFSLVGRKTNTSIGKDMQDGFVPEEKAHIKKVFLSLLWEDGGKLFEPNPSCNLLVWKTPDDIKELLKTSGIYHEGEVPPVRQSELESRVVWESVGQSTHEN